MVSLYIDLALAFGYGFAVDYLWVKLIQNITNARPAVAASLSVLLATPSLFGFALVSQDLKLAPAYLAGLWLGMYIGMYGQTTFSGHGSAGTTLLGSKPDGTDETTTRN